MNPTDLLHFASASLVLNRRRLFGLAAIPALTDVNTEPDIDNPARRLLAAWQEAKAAQDAALAQADDLVDAEADKLVNAVGDQLWAVERQICALAYSTMGRTPPPRCTGEWSPVVLSVDGWLFVCGPSAKPGALTCLNVIPPADVVTACPMQPFVHPLPQPPPDPELVELGGAVREYRSAFERIRNHVDAAGDSEGIRQAKQIVRDILLERLEEAELDLLEKMRALGATSAQVDGWLYVDGCMCMGPFADLASAGVQLPTVEMFDPARMAVCP